jgi:hypothetical protein
MSPETSKPARILLFGKDPDLLSTRASVLRSVGMIADIALDIDGFTDAGSLYDAVVCCYTATQAECKEIIAITTRNRTPLLMLQRLVEPLALIRQVTALVSQERPGPGGAAAIDPDEAI